MSPPAQRYAAATGGGATRPRGRGWPAWSALPARPARLSGLASAADPAGVAASAIMAAAVARSRLLPAAVLVLSVVVVGAVALANRDQAGTLRLRTNPALPGEGPARSTTTAPPDAGPMVITAGPGWQLLYERRAGVGGCLFVRPAGSAGLGPAACGATEAELVERGASLSVPDRAGGPVPPPDAGAGATVVAYGFVPEAAARVVFELDDGTTLAFPALPVPGAPEAFAGELPPGAAPVDVRDAGGRILYREDLAPAP